MTSEASPAIGQSSRVTGWVLAVQGGAGQLRALREAGRRAAHRPPQLRLHLGQRVDTVALHLLQLQAHDGHPHVHPVRGHDARHRHHGLPHRHLRPARQGEQAERPHRGHHQVSRGVDVTISAEESILICLLISSPSRF